MISKILTSNSILHLIFLLIDLYCQAWSDELEVYAQKALLPCSTAKDLCHKTLRFQYPGQNMGYACASSPEEAIKTVLANWWDQNKNIVSINSLTAYNSIVANGPYDEFVQMALKTGFRIGCATVAVQCKMCFYVCCNYAAKVFNANQIIFPGTLRSRCTTNSTTYPGLCGIDDVFRGTTNDGKQLFTNDVSVPATVQTFIDNGHVLFASPTDPSCFPTEPATTVPTAPTETTQPTQPTQPTQSAQPSETTVSTVSTETIKSDTTVATIAPITTSTTTTSVPFSTTGTTVSARPSDTTTIRTQTITPISSTASGNTGNSGDSGNATNSNIFSTTAVPVHAFICKKQKNCRPLSRIQHFKSHTKTDVKTEKQERDQNESKSRSKRRNKSESTDKNGKKELCKVLLRDGNQVRYKKCRSSHNNTKSNKVKFIKYQIFPKEQSDSKENVKEELPMTLKKYKIFS